VPRETNLNAAHSDKQATNSSGIMAHTRGGRGSPVKSIAALAAISLAAIGSVSAQVTTNALDVASNYATFTGNQGFGFGAWTINTPGGGKYLSADTPPYFGIWNGTANSTSTAIRPFNASLTVGQTFSVQLQMNTLDGSINTNGFKLQDANGNTLFSYWHQGGDIADGHYSDAGVANGIATGFAYDYQKLDSFAFVLNSPTNYTFTDLTTGASFSGTLSGVPITQVTFFRANGNATPSNGQDFKFNTLVITSPSSPPTQTNDGSSFVYEGFNYAPAAVSSQYNGGWGWGGAWTNVAGNALYFDLGNLIGESNAPAPYDAYSLGNHLRGYGGSRVGRLLDCSTNGVFAQNGYLNANGDIGAAGKTIYISFLQQPGVTSKFYEFEFHRNDFSDAGRIAGIGNDTDTANVNFRAPGNTHLSLGKGDTAVAFYVVRIDFHGGNDDVRVYRGPTSLTEPAVPTLTRLGTGDLSFDRLCVGVWDNFVAVDEIRIGSAWTNVIGLASTVTGSVETVAITNSMLIGQGTAAFVPAGYDSNKMPSMSLVSEPVSTGELPVNWSLVPQFRVVNSNASASLSVPPGTSLYGGGEVSGPLLRNGQTIEIWNTDTAGWTTDYLRRMYQAHPWVLGVRSNGTAFGVLFDSTYKATLTTADDRIVYKSHGPLFRVFVIDRATPQAVLQGLAELTGKISMPPLWALGYHQSRFSYSPASQVQGIANGFLTNQIPCDTIWLDIGYMNNNRDFTISPSGFPNMPSLTTSLHNNGFHVVPILDPSIAVDSSYFVYQSGTASNIWVQTSGGQSFQGNSTPGSAVWPDFTMPSARSWWSGLCKNFVTNGMDGIWIDMNEPEANNALTALNTMPYDNWHRGGGLPAGSHLQYHNAYGALEAGATYDGLIAANPNRRPFVLTRANFIGGQRHAATWTGDNVSSSNNMVVSVPMSLTLGLSGQPFSGPDIGGFIGNATADLWGNWIGFGAFFPFARGHATAGSNQKEPWAFGQTVENAARIALQRRYRLLPYLYTQFYNSSQTGIPVMQPVFFADPVDLSLRAEQQAFLLGSDVLVIPAFAQNATLPKGIWRPLSLVPGDTGQYQADLMIRGGAILPLGSMVQNTTQNMFNPLTLVVCLDSNGQASGTLYRDAGDGWGFQSGDYKLQTFTAQQNGNFVTVQLGSQQGNYAVANTPVDVQVITSNGTFFATGTIGSGITVPVDARSARAQAAFDAYNAAFYAVIDAGKAHYTVSQYDPTSGANYFWGQAEEVEGAIDAYERNPNPNNLSIVTNLLNGFSNDNGTNWSGNIYNDDIMWACIAYLRGYQISGVTQYRSIAKFNFDLVYSRGWDSLFGGGLYWTTAKAEKNACVNGPAAIVSYLLYQTLGDTNYLTKAQSIFNWEKSKLYNPANGAIYDNISTNGTINIWSSTYNQGTFVGAADYLGDITNAMLASTYTKNNLGNPDSSGYNIMIEYGPDNNNSGFNGIGIRWIAKFMKNRNFQYLYLPWLQANADAAWNTHRTADNLSWCQWLHQTPVASNLLSWDCISSMVALQVVLDSSNSMAPVFTVQPSDHVTAAGNAVTLNALATNGASISYQWYHENNPIPGATNTNLVLFSITADDAGQYWVMASNAVASAYSQVANIYLLGSTNGLLAQDSATNYNPTAGFAVNQGFGFAPWVLSTSGGGAYINSDTPLFSLWNSASNSQSTATRSFNLSMPVGSTFWVQLQMNTLDTAANKNGFELEDANGNTLFSYWHQGNDSANGHYSDALTSNGTAAGFAYDYGLSDRFKFALTSPTNYIFYDLTTARSFSGRISNAYISRVKFYRSNGAGTPSGGLDFKFTNLAITTSPSTPSPSMLSVNETVAGWNFHFPVAPGYSYRLQRATNVSGPWTNLGILTGPATGIAEFIDTNSSAPQSFYRTVTP
jgi:alpha-glucosidase